jgi:aquaporin Z
VVGRRFAASELIQFVVSQVIGAICAAGVLYVITSGICGFDLAGGFGSNGHDTHSPRGYSLIACLTAEIVTIPPTRPF